MIDEVGGGVQTSHSRWTACIEEYRSSVVTLRPPVLTISTEREKEKEKEKERVRELKQKPTQFHQLPDECLLLILDFLPLWEVPGVACVCRRLHRLALDDKLWSLRFNRELMGLYPSSPLRRRTRSVETVAYTPEKIRNFNYVQNIVRTLGQSSSLAEGCRLPGGHRSLYRTPSRNSIILCTAYVKAMQVNIWDEPEQGTLYWAERQPPYCKRVISSGTLNRLVQALTSVDQFDLQFVQAFLLTFESFTTAPMLFLKLAQRYSVPLSHQVNEKDVISIRYRVINILKLLIEKYVERVCENEWIMERLAVLVSIVLPKDGFEKLAADMKCLLRKKIHHYEKKQEQVEVLDELVPTLKYFDKQLYSPDEVARYMTVLTHLTYRSIQSSEMLNKAWMRDDKFARAPQLMSLLRRFASATHWVSSVILQGRNERTRADTIEYFIRVGQCLLGYNNFQGMTAILSSLNSFPIARLKRTWAEVATCARQEFDSMNELMNPFFQYRNYRKAISQVEPPCVPLMSVYLMDLDFLESGSYTSSSHLITFNRRQRMHEVISDALMYQSPSYSFSVEESNLPLYSYLYHLPCEYSNIREEELEQLSLSLEQGNEAE